MSGKESCLSHLWSSACRRKSIGPNSTENTATDGLERRLGLIDLILIGVGASIGAGIFVVTGTVAHDVGPGVTISFILAGVSCILNALCYAELAARFPAVVGGAYLYTYTAFGELTAFLVFAQLMLDYHIGAASIARSLASYIISLLELFTVFQDHIPSWIGRGGEKFLGGVISINILAPILLVLLTVILCRGVRESSVINSFMTALKVVIIIIVICAGAFKVDVANWSPFAPNGYKAILTGTTIVFFAYVGFDAVANSAEESKKPQRDLPIGIMGSLLICIALYVAVCLVITGMVPYNILGDEAPLSNAFKSNNMKFVSVLISIGAVAGLATTLLVGLYVQSRLYLGLGRDGLIPSLFAKVHPTLRTPIHSQIWVGIIAGILAGLFDVRILSHILSVGALTGYSVVAACVIVLRWKNGKVNKVFSKWTSTWWEAVTCLLIVAICGFATGLIYRFSSPIFMVIPVIVAILALLVVCIQHVYTSPPGFSCPCVPFLPTICIFFNMFLFAQIHFEAWIRFVILNIIAVILYAFYGQYHAISSSRVVH